MKNSLSHHGVVGMKWGVRRTRSQLDNSSGISKGKTATVSKYFEQTVPTGKGKAPISPAEKIVGKSSSVFGDAISAIDSVGRIKKIKKESKAKYKDVAEMDDKELRDVVNRMNLERQYSSLTNKDTSTGSQYVKELLNVAGSAAAIGASAVAIVATIKSMK